MNMFENTLDNKRYYTLNYFYKKNFNSKVFKVSLNAGFTCPNKDGTKGVGGCIYCSPSGSGDFAGNIKDNLVKQFNEVRDVMLKKWPDAKYIAYFQANSNTYAPVQELKEKYESVINLPGVIGLSIATRPDCFNKEIYDYYQVWTTQGMPWWVELILAIVLFGGGMVGSYFLVKYKRNHPQVEEEKSEIE